MLATQSYAGPLGRLSPLEDTASGKVLLSLCASLVVALCAHVSLPLLFTPVPLTLSNFAVILVGLVLGPRLGFSALVLYLMEGAAGLPVFTPGGLGGVAQLLGPTAGYLFAYPFAAGLAGWVGSRQTWHRSRFVLGLLAGFFATSLVLFSGVLWLASATHLSAQAALAGGLIPFLPGEALKIVVAAGLFRTLTSRPATDA